MGTIKYEPRESSRDANQQLNQLQGNVNQLQGQVNQSQHQITELQQSMTAMHALIYRQNDIFALLQNEIRLMRHDFARMQLQFGILRGEQEHHDFEILDIIDIVATLMDEVLRQIPEA
ncbi:unnamed protein product [Rotaria socialis]|uniref:Uncharacterized protein n=1 Tax=Rotaria socialis TaxID=392032 RepID=A0A818DB28_9BILA|nr:unnamed protein product [Rotaria socialis]CAF3365381.1 unnamed protein product [Rotaria socialis]CAF3444806.1 unnamed protein product [Rotaria socialis]CAF3560866.1 unnamed protein product [Rotaria socialis]CAF4246476.1 unnamed protein product [Rotaria socialis]